MAIKSNIALGYIAMLSVVGFFLWIIRNFVRSMRQKDEALPVATFPEQTKDTHKKSVDWSVHIFLNKEDDIPIPGRLSSLSPAYAFMESSACLHTGEDIALYVDVPGQDQVRLTAKVIWAREGRDGKNAAQLQFHTRSFAEKMTLYELA